ncbi:hypothetical protein [Shinella sp. JR1-6]|uniref:hypothetical protein n=1 Tax=Shinella sp. JR1-6 TaxID=2527671 RepID=UPI00102D6274|nr:hypothetical protein [Shinella sp. JR1-6]TAA54809.1 hypothetical protein EXZ48_25915 [Shinella sp. JR1-6]
MLYTRNGSYPASIPPEITLSTGFIRTDPSTFTETEIADAGYVVAPAPPAYDPATQQLGWDGSAWSVTALPPAPFPTLKRKELRSALVSIDIFAADVTAKISEIADPTAREFALIDWEDTQDYERDHPLVDTLAVGFALPSEQVDALWRWAAGA